MKIDIHYNYTKSHSVSHSDLMCIPHLLQRPKIECCLGK